jgi:hypothetical protein
LAEIKEAPRKRGCKSQEKVSSVAQVLIDARRTNVSRPITITALVVLGMMGTMGSLVNAFTAYNFMIWSKIVELYSLL